MKEIVLQEKKMNPEGKIKVDMLTPHPQNNYYFDDMDGDAWDALIQSISTSGVTNAITITDKNVIISGHQRVRACKVLGINEISYKMIRYNDEDTAIKDLIESNLRQRVLGNPNPVKMGRCFDFLQKYYGIRHGNNQHNRIPKASESLTQEQLADIYGVSADTINNYVKLTKALPEIGDFVENGVISKSTALSVIKLLSPNEQDELVSQLDATKRYTQKEIREYIRQIKSLEDELQARPEKEVGVSVSDYNEMKQKAMDYQSDYERLCENYDKIMAENSAKIKEVQELKRQIALSDEPQEQFKRKIKDNTIFFCAKVSNFIKEVGGYVWLTDYINDMPEREKKSYMSAVTNIAAWAENIRANIKM